MVRNIILLLALSFILGQGLHTHNFEIFSGNKTAKISVSDNDKHLHGLCPGCLTNTFKTTNEFKISLISLEQPESSGYVITDFLISDTHTYNNLPTRSPPTA